MHVSNSSLGTSNQSSSSNSMRQPNRLSFPRRRPFPLSHSDPSSPVPSPIGNDVTDPFRLHRAPHVPITPRQSDVSASMLWLSVYFGLNLGLTLFNKTLLVHFPYPYTLTSVHAMVGSMGCYGLEYAGLFKPKVLKVSDTTALGLFSLLYTLNIVVSNKSLHLVTIPFHQVARAVSPAWTILLSRVLLGTRITRIKILSLIPVVAGVAFATYGDYYFTYIGLILTLFGALLAALKTIYIGALQTRPTISSTSTLKNFVTSPPRLGLHPLDILYRMSPLAFIQSVALSYFSGELHSVHQWSAVNMDRKIFISMLINGGTAFALNVTNFVANGKTGALTMAVAANVKQVLTILLAVFIFDLKITPMNALGVILTLSGGAWYARVEYLDKMQRRRRSSASR